MGNSREEKEDPTWGRSKGLKTKHKMFSRGSLKNLRDLIKQKKAADRRKDKIIRCATRTVELPSTQNPGNVESKLLFMIAIGLVPNSNSRKPQLPLVMVEKMDTMLEKQAATKTTERMFQLLQNRQFIDPLQGRVLYRVIQSPIKGGRPLMFLPSNNVESVEFVDLVSDDEEDDDVEYTLKSSNNGEPEPVINCASIGSLPSRIRQQRLGPHPAIEKSDSDPAWCSSESGYRILTSKPRQPVFKPILNNQDSGIFRNWKPESMSRLMNMNNKSNHLVDSSPGSQSKILSSLQSFTTPISNSSLSVKGSSAAMYQESTYNTTQNLGKLEGSSSLPVQRESDVITID